MRIHIQKNTSATARASIKYYQLDLREVHKVQKPYIYI